LKFKGDSPPFLDPDMVRRQQKTLKYYPYQLVAIGWWRKRNAISQVAYNYLASVLTKANRVA
jgi:hypothetical protein